MARKPTPEAMRAELAELERIVAKRRGKPGFSANVEDIDRRIAELKAGLG